MESIEEEDKDTKYCHCGNIMIWDIGNRSDVKMVCVPILWNRKLTSV
jgi:hypothetical protein